MREEEDRSRGNEDISATTRELPYLVLVLAPVPSASYSHLMTPFDEMLDKTDFHVRTNIKVQMLL